MCPVRQVQCKYKHPFVFRVTGEVPTVRVQFSHDMSSLAYQLEPPEWARFD